VKKRNSKAEKIFSVFLFSSWISFMAIAGFFIPSFLTQLPMFQIKEVVVEGNEKIPLESVKTVIEELSGNLLRLNGTELKESLNGKFGGRVKEVLVSKDIKMDGIRIKVEVVERSPVAKVRVGEEFLLIDDEGDLFYPMDDDLKKLVELRTYDLQVLEKNFTKLRREILSSGLPIQQIDIRRDKILLHINEKEIILPPIDLLSENVSSRLKLIYNFPEENVDLRYGRFILARN